MIPYLEPPSWQIGSLELSAFRVFAMAAVAVAYLVTIRRAPRFGIDADTATSMIGWGIVAGLISAHVFDVLMYYPAEFLANPLSLFTSWGSLSSTGGMLGGIAALWAVAKWKGLNANDARRFLDVVIFGLPFSLATGRVGCALVHDHLGIASNHFLAVAFPSGGRFDLGLLEAAGVAVIALGFIFLDRQGRDRAPGFWLALFFASYAPLRFGLDTLRVGEIRYAGMTPAQLLAIGAALAAWTWLFRRRRAGS